MPQILQSEQKTVSATAHSLKKPRLPINSFGFRFFAMIMGGALISIASIAFLFAETIKFQAEEQIQQLLESKVGTINEVTDRAENLAYSLGVSVATLHVRGAETPETYQVLTQKLFESHPSYVLGMGFGQKENGILPERQWFYPYYQIESAAASLAQRSPTDAPQTTAEAEVIDYINRADEPYFYPTSESYRQYFLPQKSLWRSPYQRENDTLITFYSQIFGNQDEWLGTSVIDVDAAYLQAILNEPVFRQGGQLMLLDLNGQVIANPVNEDVATDQTYQDIPGLNEIWSQIEGENSSGLIEGETGYWSYIQIPEQSWVVLAYVPYGTVFGRILAITLGATLLAGLLMAGLTTLAIRYLNKRLRPVINECQRLSTEDETVTQRLIGKDELEQLSISFFNLLEQLQLSQTQVKLEAAHASEVETQLSQIKDRTVANQRRQRQVTRKLANILPPESNASIATASSTPVYLSTQQIQQELSQLNQVVSTLAEDDWLLETLEARNSDPSAQNTTELTQV
ncbi:MAG: cache domain-containing protein, partial [Cyanobacteria bacterium J06621_11]